MGHKVPHADGEPRKADHAPRTCGCEQPAASDEAERLKQEAAQAKDRYLRMLADVENTRKRLAREKEEFARFAAETVVRALLPVMDSLDQALVAVDRKSDADAVVKGVHLIHRQLHGVLEKEGVRRIPTVGEPFDPHRHEAVAQVETADAADDTVVEEVQVGYTMHGTVIRPAMVKVAKPHQQSEVRSPKSEADTETQGGSNG